LPAQTVMLKLQTADFKLPTRSHALSGPPQLAAKVFAAGHVFLRHEADGTQFRLIGIAVFEFLDAARGDPDDLLDERAFTRGGGQTCARSRPRQIRPRSGRRGTDTDKQRCGFNGRAWCS
jgi:DNA polymerase IV